MQQQYLILAKMWTRRSKLMVYMLRWAYDQQYPKKEIHSLTIADYTMCNEADSKNQI